MLRLLWEVQRARNMDPLRVAEALGAIKACRFVHGDHYAIITRCAACADGAGIDAKQLRLILAKKAPAIDHRDRVIIMQVLQSALASGSVGCKQLLDASGSGRGAGAGTGVSGATNDEIVAKQAVPSPAESGFHSMSLEDVRVFAPAAYVGTLHDGAMRVVAAPVLRAPPPGFVALADGTPILWCPAHAGATVQYEENPPRPWSDTERDCFVHRLPVLAQELFSHHSNVVIVLPSWLNSCWYLVVGVTVKGVIPEGELPLDKSYFGIPVRVDQMMMERCARVRAGGPVGPWSDRFAATLEHGVRFDLDGTASPEERHAASAATSFATCGGFVQCGGVCFGTTAAHTFRKFDDSVEIIDAPSVLSPGIGFETFNRWRDAIAIDEYESKRSDDPGRLGLRKTWRGAVRALAFNPCEHGRALALSMVVSTKVAVDRDNDVALFSVCTDDADFTPPPGRVYDDDVRDMRFVLSLDGGDGMGFWSRDEWMTLCEGGSVRVEGVGIGARSWVRVVMADSAVVGFMRPMDASHDEREQGPADCREEEKHTARGVWSFLAVRNAPEPGSSSADVSTAPFCAGDSGVWVVTKHDRRLLGVVVFTTLSKHIRVSVLRPAWDVVPAWRALIEADT